MSALLLHAGLTAFLASLLVSFLARTGGVLDRPEHRSLHDRPTPRAGGLGVLAGVGAGALAIASAPLSAAALPAILAFTALCGALGLADDLFELGGRLKFAVLAVLCLALAALDPVVFLPITREVFLPLPWLIGVLGSALFLFTVINAANFMDGSDAMMTAVLIPAGIGLAFSGLVAGAGATTLAGVLLASALLAFLVFNRPKASVFAGDCGSLGAGALYAGGALFLAGEGFAGSVWLAPLFVLPFLADVLLTLARRARHGRLSLQAHSEHLFQRLIKAGWSHGQAASAYGGATAACVLAGLVTAQIGDAAVFTVFWIAVAGLSGGYLVLSRRLED